MQGWINPSVHYHNAFGILQEMIDNKHYSAPYLIGRSLLPSAISGLLCGCFSLLLIGLHLLLLSLNIGTALPQFFDGQWGIAYTNTIVQPLQTLFNNLAFNNVLSILLWGVAGLATYLLIEYVMHLHSGWRHAEDDIQIVGERVIYHPARRSFITTVLWRVCILIIFTAIFILAQLPLQRLLATDPELVVGGLSLVSSVRKLTIELVGWTLFAHCVVVFLRLFLMRTRLFGDSVIE